MADERFQDDGAARHRGGRHKVQDQGQEKRSEAPKKSQHNNESRRSSGRRHPNANSESRKQAKCIVGPTHKSLMCDDVRNPPFVLTMMGCTVNLHLSNINGQREFYSKCEIFI